MTKLDNRQEIVPTDILVIGGGISGLVAAIKARDYPVNVLVVDKATVGWSGQVPNSGGHSMILAPAHDINQWVKWIVNEGEYINDQEWAYSFAEDSYKCHQEVADWGTPILKDEKDMIEVQQRYGAQGHAFIQYDPRRMLLSLRARARARGVRILNKIEVVEVIKQDDRIIGALGFNIVDGRFYLFQARATIIANGGCGYKTRRLFTTSCGEGIAMAYRAGAQLRNAEFGNRYGLVTKDYQGRGRNLETRYCFNALGENIIDKYCPAAADQTDYRPAIQAIVKELMAGRGPLYLDLTKVSRETIVKGQSSATFWRLMERLGIDPFSQKIEWMLTFGGQANIIRVDLKCRTTVKGLFAIGDASNLGSAWTGVQSIGDMPALGISYAVVSGIRAGESAADFTSEVTPIEVDLDKVNKLKAGIFAPLAKRDGVCPDEAIYRIQEIVVPIKYNYIRSAERLEEALVKLKDLQRILELIRADDYHDLVKYHEFSSMLVCAEAGFSAALMRTESRETHFREDYPQRDNHNWLKWIIIQKKNQEMNLSTESVPIHKYKVKPS